MHDIYVTPASRCSAVAGYCERYLAEDTTMRDLGVS